MGQPWRLVGHHLPPCQFCKGEDQVVGRPQRFSFSASPLHRPARIIPARGGSSDGGTQDAGARLYGHGLLRAQLFLEAFDRHQVAIHDAARRKYACGECELEGDVLVLLHRRDLG